MAKGCCCSWGPLLLFFFGAGAVLIVFSTSTQLTSASYRKYEEELLSQERRHQRIFGDRHLFLSSPRSRRTIFYMRPTWNCPSMEIVGNPSLGDGPKWMCVEEMRHAKDDCLVYSVGINAEISWDLAFHARWPNCEMHAFEKKASGPALIRKKLGISNITTHYNFEFIDLEKHMSDLNHTDRYLSVFKVDIEGGEYPLFEVLLSGNHSGVRWADRIGQILMEVHLPGPEEHQRLKRLLYLLESHGFRMFSSEANQLCCAEGSWISNHGADRMLAQRGETVHHYQVP